MESLKPRPASSTSGCAPSQWPPPAAVFATLGVDTSAPSRRGGSAPTRSRPAPHRWRWREIGPYLDRIADIARNSDVSPIEFAERQHSFDQDPGSAAAAVTHTIRAQSRSTMPGDVAPVHITQRRTRAATILSDNGGYTVVEGRARAAARGEPLPRRHGHWHDHGNDGATSVM